MFEVIVIFFILFLVFILACVGVLVYTGIRMTKSICLALARLTEAINQK